MITVKVIKIILFAGNAIPPAGPVNVVNTDENYLIKAIPANLKKHCIVNPSEVHPNDDLIIPERDIHIEDEGETSKK
jgi:hypothetical protein